MWIIRHPDKGVLMSYDPFGKQESEWHSNPEHAWVFQTWKKAKLVRATLPRHLQPGCLIEDPKKGDTDGTLEAEST